MISLISAESFDFCGQLVLYGGCCVCIFIDDKSAVSCSSPLLSLGQPVDLDLEDMIAKAQSDCKQWLTLFVISPAVLWAIWFPHHA